jgi:hypothetical protein
LLFSSKMLHLTKGQTETVILTLKEKQQLVNSNFLFYFKSKVNNTEVKFVVLAVNDLSGYKDRFNEFSLVVNTYFATALPGEYGYTIYEQTSSSNLDPSLATGILETGQMELNNSTDFEFTTYNATTNTYKVRDI